MASHTLALYMACNSTYDLEGVPTSIDFVPDSSYVRDEARLITEAPLAIMPPPNYTMSGGNSLKTTTHSKAPLYGTKEKKTPSTRPTTGAIGLKREANEVSEVSKC